MAGKIAEIFKDGLWTKNPGLVQLLGLCPLLAVTSTATNALGLGLATIAVLTISNVLIAMIRRLLREEVRIIMYVIIIASVVTCVQLCMQAYCSGIYETLGLYISLIVTNCIIIARAEIFASKNNVGLAALDILHHRKQIRALLPLGLTSQDNEVIVHLNVPTPPLCLDTLTVKKVTHYGFSVITPDNRDIAERIIIEGENIHILCTENPVNVKVRYAVNGEPMKSGRIHGPRGNLCDAAGHWCYQFDMLCK